MLPLEILRKVRRMHITASHMVTGAFAGHYQSVFRGRGMEFEEVRQYQPGDDIRSIDWNVTARMGHPYVKKFVEERELTVMFLLDLSASCRFGTAHRFKADLAAELCALLSFSAFKNNDRVGLISFTDRVEKFIPPGKGLRHILRVARDVLSEAPQGRGTDIPAALDFLNRVSRRTVAFLVSDFHAKNLRKPLAVAAKRHDLIAVALLDPAEWDLPDVGLLRLQDAESGSEFLIDTSVAEFRRDYRERGRKRIAERIGLFNSIPVDHIDIRTDVPYLATLMQFFRARERRRSR